MKTSYYAKYKNINGDAVSISLYTPIWYGKNKDWPKIDTYPDLYPTWDMIRKFKADKDEEEYIKLYYEEVLNKLNPRKVYNNLHNKVLLCYEKPEDFCHRHLVAKWLMESLKIKIEEVNYGIKKN